SGLLGRRRGTLEIGRLLGGELREQGLRYQLENAGALHVRPKRLVECAHEPLRITGAPKVGNCSAPRNLVAQHEFGAVGVLLCGQDHQHARERESEPEDLFHVGIPQRLSSKTKSMPISFLLRPGGKGGSGEASIIARCPEKSSAETPLR